MSRTDAHRPEWVQCNDSYGSVYESHYCHGRPCDLPPFPVTVENAYTTVCDYMPAGKLYKSIYGYSYCTVRGRKHNRKRWFASERAEQRVILRAMTREANSGDGEVSEDRHRNRQTHRNVMFDKGYWD